MAPILWRIKVHTSCKITAGSRPRPVMFQKLLTKVLQMLINPVTAKGEFD